jgi:hypothetical protein
MSLVAMERPVSLQPDDQALSTLSCSLGVALGKLFALCKYRGMYVPRLSVFSEAAKKDLPGRLLDLSRITVAFSALSFPYTHYHTLSTNRTVYRRTIGLIKRVP